MRINGKRVTRAEKKRLESWFPKESEANIVNCVYYYTKNITSPEDVRMLDIFCLHKDGCGLSPDFVGTIVIYYSFMCGRFRCIPIGDFIKRRACSVKREQDFLAELKQRFNI